LTYSSKGKSTTKLFRKLAVASCSLSFAFGIATSATAQELKRTELSRTDLTGVDGKEVVVSMLEAPAGSTSVRHFHHGDEVLYVLDGAMIQVPGQEPQARMTRSVGYNKREIPHAGYKLIGGKPLKLLSIYIVGKGKPL
jgi:hypothetical protein